jgi:hypothetical protein
MHLIGLIFCHKFIEAHVIFQTPTTNFPTPARQHFWENKNLLQGIIGFGREILPDTAPPPRQLKGASFAPAIKQSFK